RMSTTKLVIAASAILLMAAAFAVEHEPGNASDTTSASVAALKANLGNPAGLVIDEVRVTDNGVACIEYRVSKSRGHAVVQSNEVLKSSSDSERFDKAWNEHCLGPRGGMTSSQ
ncbi:MAG TPA: hypothetical protein VFS58_11535, partial [Steroidobacteraceae bacterium]|nr:hypothetical protein [Steroidobacteraceae bacterium]